MPNIKASNSRYSTVNMCGDDRIAATATTTSSKNNEPRDQNGYIQKKKVFLTPTSSNSCIILCTVGMLFSLFLTIFMWFTDMYTSEIFKRLIIQKDGFLYDLWQEQPVKPLLCVYIFNYTNVDKYMSKEHPKLKVQEVGPYCYRETVFRVNVTDHKNGSQSYNEMKILRFDYDESIGIDTDDMITLPDIPYISAIALTKDENFFMRKSLSSLLNQVSGNTPFVTVSVYEFCFGYQNSVVKLLKTIGKIVNKPTPFEKFGLITKRVGINPDRLTVYNGHNNLNEMGQILLLNGESLLHPWSSDGCNSVGGSDGLFFPRNEIKLGQTIYYFQIDACRKFPMTFHSKKKIQNGIIGHLYSLETNIFNNSVPENSCYCTSEPCMPDGIFDIGPCSTGTPIVISRAHFLFSDPSLLNAVEGLNPDPEKHEFFILVDPIIGVTMETEIRVQVNVQVRNPNDEDPLSIIPDNTILPCTWMEIKTGKISSTLSTVLFHLTFTLQWFQIFLMYLSLVGLLGTSFCLIRMLTRGLYTSFQIKLSN